MGIAKGERRKGETSVERRASSLECKRGKAEIKKLEIGKVGKWKSGLWREKTGVKLSVRRLDID